MKNAIFVLILLAILIVCGKAYSYDNPGYPYSDAQCRLDGPSDPFGFRLANCTSYAAYMLNGYGIPFINYSYHVDSYNDCSEGNKWGDGGCWDDAARNAGIPVDTHPLPGDIAYWNGGTHGHVAWVEKVYYDSNGYVSSIDVTEYNYNDPGCTFGQRNIAANNPDGFIHILAYNETVTGMHYLDCYEMDSLCPNQTKGEWWKIVQQVWSNYRCTNCNGNYSTAYVNSLAKVIGGMGGGPGLETIPTDSATPSLPDFITQKVTLSTPWNQEIYAYGYNETVIIDSYIKNIGEANWAGDRDDMYVKAYLSNGYREDSHSEWRNVGTGQILRGNIDVGTTKHEAFTVNLATINNGGPLQPGIYNFVVCADRKYDSDNGDGEVPEMHKSNNCSTEAVFEIKEAPQTNFPYVDFIVPSISLINTPLPVPAGGLYSAKMAIRNIGNMTSPSGIRSQYAINGPGTNGQWWQIADDGSDAGELTPGRDQWEDIGASVQAPSVPGTYSLRGCADYQNNVSEKNESNNCSYYSFQVYAQPSIVVTNPTSTDNWRSSYTKHITWQANYFPVLGDVRIEYSMDGGASWRTIDSSTANDGSRYWNMCDSTTKDSSNSYIRIRSLSYPNVFGMSQRFTIDHASGCD